MRLEYTTCDDSVTAWSVEVRVVFVPIWHILAKHYALHVQVYWGWRWVTVSEYGGGARRMFSTIWACKRGFMTGAWLSTARSQVKRRVLVHVEEDVISNSVSSMLRHLSWVWRCSVFQQSHHILSKHFLRKRDSRLCAYHFPFLEWNFPGCDAEHYFRNWRLWFAVRSRGFLNSAFCACHKRENVVPILSISLAIPHEKVAH